MQQRTNIALVGFAMLTASFVAGCDSPSGSIMNPASENTRATTSGHGSHGSAGGSTGLGNDDGQRLIAAARAATAKYHNVEVARGAGYVEDGFGCISEPGIGGMGIHFINLEIDIDPSIDLAKPELLLYEPGKNGKLKLVGVEYEVFQADWWGAGNTAPPTLFGREFEAMIFPGLDPLFGLHVWLWKNNPSGMFEAFNPEVRCP